MGSVAKPKAPPAAPDAVARVLCRSCDPARGVRCIVCSATLRAASRPLAVAVAIAREAAAGSALPMSSIGLPTRLVRRAARPGCSSNRMAVRSAARSAVVMVGPSLVATGALLTSVSTHRQPGAIKVVTSGRYALARSTAVASVNATQQSGRFRGRSGHRAHSKYRSLMTDTVEKGLALIGEQ